MTMDGHQGRVDSIDWLLERFRDNANRPVLVWRDQGSATAS